MALVPWTEMINVRQLIEHLERLDPTAMTNVREISVRRDSMSPAQQVFIWPHGTVGSAVLQEREACAAICEAVEAGSGGSDEATGAANKCARDIRARGR